MKCGSHRLNILSFPALSCQRQFPAGVGEAEHLIQCTVIPKGDRWLAAQQTQQDTITYRSALILRFGVPEYDSQKREAWVQRVTGPLVDGDLRVTEAEHEHREARDALIGRPEQAQMARLAAYARVFGTNNVLHNRQSYLSANPAQQGGRGLHRRRSRCGRKPNCSLTSPRLRLRRRSTRRARRRPLASCSVPNRSPNAFRALNGSNYRIATHPITNILDEAFERNMSSTRCSQNFRSEVTS